MKIGSKFHWADQVKIITNATKVMMETRDYITDEKRWPTTQEQNIISGAAKEIYAAKEQQWLWLHKNCNAL